MLLLWMYAKRNSISYASVCFLALVARPRIDLHLVLKRSKGYKIRTRRPLIGISMVEVLLSKASLNMPGGDKSSTSIGGLVVECV
jgi:hypothetical protein